MTVQNVLKEKHKKFKSIVIFISDLGRLSLKSEIGAGTETIQMNGTANGTAANGSEPGSPQLKTPTFMVSLNKPNI